MNTVLLTGAAGKVGKHAVSALRAQGMRVVATDLISDGLPRDVYFERCDLTDANAVQRLVARAQPDAVAHCAAVVAPISYAEPELSAAVNLGGTRHLIDAVKRHAPNAFFVFVSSYAAFGPVCPNDPHRRAIDPSAPVDNYGQQKLAAETWLRGSGLRQCSLRVGAVMDMHSLMPNHWSYRPFMFMVPLDQPEHGVDVRDVARAVAAAAARQPNGRLLLIGGDESWKRSARSLREEMLGAMGLRLPKETAYRGGIDRSTSDGWFYECWMDTTESQELLGFQTIGRRAFLEEMRDRKKRQRLALSLVRPWVLQWMVRSSPYRGKGRIAPGPTLLDDLRQVYGAAATGMQEGIRSAASAPARTPRKPNAVTELLGERHVSNDR